MRKTKIVSSLSMKFFFSGKGPNISCVSIYMINRDRTLYTIDNNDYTKMILRIMSIDMHKIITIMMKGCVNFRLQYRVNLMNSLKSHDVMTLISL